MSTDDYFGEINDVGLQDPYFNEEGIVHKQEDSEVKRIKIQFNIK